MTQTAYPFDAGSGSAIVEGQWRAMARNWVPSGVMANELNLLKVVGDSTGMQVKASSGRAWVNGHFYENDAQVTLALAAANATNPRLDLVVLRADFTANTIVLAVVTGTAAANPVAPALTQSASTWEIALARVRVNAAVVTIAPGDVTDLRAIVGGTVVRREIANPAMLNSAVGDGATDVSVAFQEAIDKVAQAGGGEVFAGEGTSMVKGLVMKTGVKLFGAGPKRTQLKQPSGLNTDVIVGDNFGALTGSAGSGGIYQFAIRDLAVDGNKAANPTTGYGVRLYGYDFVLERVRIRNCRQDGLWSEWGSMSNDPGPDSMEATLRDVKSHDNAGRGITWKGPHDSTWDSVIAYLNGAEGIYVLGDGAGVFATNCHSWGAGQTYAWRAEAQVNLVNCVGEGATTAQLLLAALDCVVEGGQYYAAGAVATKGIILGDATHAPNGALIDTKIINCDGGAIDFTYDAGSNIVRAMVYQTGGTVFVGSAHGATVVDVNVSGIVAPARARQLAVRELAFTAPDAGQAKRFRMGNGAPSAYASMVSEAGDFYFRYDTPNTANQRIYVCTVSGTPGTWVALTV